MLLKCDRESWRQARLAELNYCWHTRDLKGCCRVSRLLSGFRLGPKRRRFDRPRSVQPTCSDRLSYLEQPGFDCGCQSKSINWRTVLQAASQPKTPARSAESAQGMIFEGSADLDTEYSYAKGIPLGGCQRKFGDKFSCQSGNFPRTSLVLDTLLRASCPRCIFDGSFNNYSCQSGCMTRFLFNGNEARSLSWTSTMASPSALEFVPSTIWIPWASFTSDGLAAVVRNSMTGTTLQDTFVVRAGWTRCWFNMLQFGEQKKKAYQCSPPPMMLPMRSTARFAVSYTIGWQELHGKRTKCYSNSGIAKLTCASRLAMEPSMFNPKFCKGMVLPVSSPITQRLMNIARACLQQWVRNPHLWTLCRNNVLTAPCLLMPMTFAKTHHC